MNLEKKEEIEVKKTKINSRNNPGCPPNIEFIVAFLVYSMSNKTI